MRRLLVVAVLLLPSLAQASAVTYEIDYALLECSTVSGWQLPQAPRVTTFAYDADTALFDYLAVTWPSSTGDVVAVFTSTEAGWSGYHVNLWAPESRAAFFSRLLDGGLWAFGTGTLGIDAWVAMNDVSFYLRGGNTMGDRASGTFTTAAVSAPLSAASAVTAVPEPSTGLLGLMGAFMVWGRRLRCRSQSRTGSRRKGVDGTT